jgi:dimethylamine monooxygenase subunit A
MGQAVFTITVALQPLTEAVRNVADALRLQQALASMTDAVLAYKRLTAARAPLLYWLSQRAMHGLLRRPRSV